MGSGEGEMRLLYGWRLAEIFLTCVEGEEKIIMETESVCFVFAPMI